MTSGSAEKSTIAASHHGNIARAFELLAEGMGDFISQHMSRYFGDEPYWAEKASSKLGRPSEHGANDPLFQLLLLRRFWAPVFAEHYREDLRDLITDLIEIRNRWAHFNLPNETSALDRTILGIERILAPIAPDYSKAVREIRFLVKNPSVNPSPTEIDLFTLEEELENTKKVFEELQKKQETLLTELGRSKKLSAKKQLKLTSLEHQLLTVQGKSLAAEKYLLSERQTKNRIEWLFVGLLAAIILVLFIINQ